MLAKPATRWGAFGIHLAISVIIFIVLAAIIVFAWYPGFLFRTDGGWQGIRLIAGIDLVLGPLLTLIVYNRTKKSLPFDLAIIAAVQVTALAAGCWLVYQERPIAVVFADQRFSTMSQNSFTFNGIDPDAIALLSASRKPVWIFADSIPSMPGESAIENFNRLGPRHLRIEDYAPFEQHAYKLETLGFLKIEGEAALPPEGHLRYYKMLSRYFEGYLLMDLQNWKVVKTILTNSTDIYGVSAK
ncbi:MAG: hypothetical protein WBN40_07785 [Pseudomonadales bacterium]